MTKKKHNHSTFDSGHAPRKGIPFPSSGAPGKGSGKTAARTAPMSSQKTHFKKAP